MARILGLNIVAYGHPNLEYAVLLKNLTPHCGDAPNLEAVFERTLFSTRVITHNQLHPHVSGDFPGSSFPSGVLNTIAPVIGDLPSNAFMKLSQSAS